jgi:hypothetical protein
MKLLSLLMLGVGMEKERQICRTHIALHNAAALKTKLKATGYYGLHCRKANLVHRTFFGEYETRPFASHMFSNGTSTKIQTKKNPRNP